MYTKCQLLKVNAAICFNKMCKNNCHISKYVFKVSGTSIAARKTNENAVRVTSEVKTNKQYCDMMPEVRIFESEKCCRGSHCYTMAYVAIWLFSVKVKKKKVKLSV
jgi:hypothetical protein